MDIDISHLFHLAYDGALQEFKQRDTSRKDQKIGRTLAKLLPEHYSNINISYSGYLLGGDHEKQCVASLVRDKEIPIRFYDFGALGFRPEKIAASFNSSAAGYRICEVSLVDSSQEVIKDTLGHAEGEVEITSALQDEFRQVAIPPLYEEVSKPQEQFDPHGNPYADTAYCRCNFEKRVFALLGRTINNFSQPSSVLFDAFYENMSPLDILVVEGRTSADTSSRGYHEYLEFMRSHVRENLGLEDYTDSCSSVFIESVEGSVFAYLRLTKDLIDEGGRIGDRGEMYPKGTSMLIAYNKPLELESFLADNYKNGLFALDAERCDDDTIVYFRKGMPLPGFYAEGMAGVFNVREDS